MKYKVIKTFKDNDVVRSVGDIIEADGTRAMKLLQYKLIGLYEEEKKVEVIEKKEVVEKIEVIEKAVKEEPKKENTKKSR